MLFWFHLLFTIAFIAILAVTGTICPNVKEEYDALSSGKKTLIAAMPYIAMGLIWIFPLGNAILRADSFFSFYNRFSLELATASFLNIFIFLSGTKTGKMVESGRWAPYVLFVVYTCIKNFVINGFWMGILAEALALITLAVFAGIAFIFGESTSMKTKAQIEKEDREMEVWRQKQAREEEYQRERAARLARMAPAAPKTTYSSSSGSDSSDRSSSSDNDRGIRYCCINCRYYGGGICNCKGTSSYERQIFDPYSESCGYFHSSYRL